MPIKPILAVHRRNRIEQLAAVPKGAWIEIDLDMHEGTIYLHHDPMGTAPADINPAPDRFDAFLEAAVKTGIGGFIVDCKRENVEKLAQPLLDKYKITNFFYLNEMEIQADIFLEKAPTHRNGVRIWKYRGADEVIRYVRDMKATGYAAPTWSWVDCWQHGLLENIEDVFLPLNGKQAKDLQDAGVKLCICSPELYNHQYGKDYSAEKLGWFEKGIKLYQQKLNDAGINADAICTKFPQWWNL